MIIEEAIEEINKVFEPAFANYIITALTEGVTVSDKALEQEPCGDAISREEVMDVLSDSINDDKDYHRAVVLLNNLPSVTPKEKTRWIPVSERLPEVDGEYLATIYDMDEGYKYMDIAELENDIWNYKNYIKVLAWMPLPAPFEPQESEDKEVTND